MVERWLDAGPLLLDHDIVVNVDMATSSGIGGLSLSLDDLLFFEGLSPVGSVLLKLANIVKNIPAFGFVGWLFHLTY
jgi:hypothetical protein